MAPGWILTIFFVIKMIFRSRRCWLLALLISTLIYLYLAIFAVQKEIPIDIVQKELDFQKLMISSHELCNSGLQNELKFHLSSRQLPNNDRQNELEFQKILEDVGISVFLIEPRWLIKLLTREDLFFLGKRKIDLKKLSRSDHLTTFGIFEENSIFINVTLGIFRSNSYSYSKTEALDAREFHWHEKRNKRIVLTTHHFFVKRNHVFHLLVFFKRKTFLWTSAITSLPLIVSNHLKLEQLVLGGYAAAFEKFNITTYKESNSNYIIRVPSDIRQFLFELPSSRFLECNYKVARQFYGKTWERSKPDMELDYVTFFAIKAVKKVLKPLLVPFWITSGTLLGWYRQCDVIPYTSDIDLAGWAQDIDSSLQAQVMKNKEELILRAIFGLRWESYQYVFTFHNLRVDFFFTYKGQNYYWYGGHTQDVFFHYNYPKFVLCSGELVGLKVLVPCNPEDVVSAEYGKNWQFPVEKWDYAHSAFNIGPKFYWPKNLVNKTHIVFNGESVHQLLNKIFPGKWIGRDGSSHSSAITLDYIIRHLVLDVRPGSQLCYKYV